MTLYARAVLTVPDSGRGIHNLTASLQTAVRDSSVHTGLCHVFIKHTSASLIVTENADPDVHRDLERYLTDLVPDGDPRYLHTAEGPDDMAAHVRSVLTLTELSIPVANGELDLGVWQGVYLWEHRHQPHQRELIVTTHGVTAT